MIIDIVSDVVCPWCFIGKRRLERALAVRGRDDVQIVWRAFQLNPDMPREGMDRAHYLAAKFGSAAQARRIYDEIAETGAAEGIAFAFSRIARTPNTLDAHRLIRLAAAEGRQDAVVEALFRAYFLDGIDIGAREALIAIAERAGIAREIAETYLASQDALDAVRREDLGARRLGITGVPCFIVNGRYAISGAQAPEIFLRVFETVEQTEDDANPRPNFDI